MSKNFKDQARRAVSAFKISSILKSVKLNGQLKKSKNSFSCKVNMETNG